MRNGLKRALKRCVPRRLLIEDARGRRREVALTFDDGPHPQHTEQILRILREEAVPATFFLVGREVEKDPALARAIAQEGHAIGNHSFSHGRLPRMTTQGLADDIEQTAAVIRQATGISTRLYRPPYGTLTLPLLGYAWSRRWTIVLWSVDSQDSRQASPSNGNGMREAVRSAGPGDIVLLHEDYPHTVTALREMIRDLKRRGLSFTTVNTFVDPIPQHAWLGARGSGLGAIAHSPQPKAQSDVAHHKAIS